MIGVFKIRVVFNYGYLLYINRFMLLLKFPLFLLRYGLI